ncbi:MAG: sulfoxide reductase heme-binding subunit YedZ [Xanthomonadales bacterium]|nr:sulfoxide reductase heme-binding subunit YedZ [Gammaproteobacteria bacterium]MBT8050331.1 sulfoxide reductase heme-binding subunit YedZ [Gammaproteobacteria bacterium]MBT8056080.1 sulfoxide reductase heme-binding subunit YedZ [Gammaproteobacteria bacterium]NNJ79898.1 sulfoxide reductase heme-binding subunit YedZ [Xanthomonadales bacterium]NNL04183.1 sulfoxide reductase heme-binding subunit YedZ [Xanthomonadales bacterium]
MKAKHVRLLKVPVFGLSLIPLAILVAEILGLWGLSLGTNPVEALIHFTGTWGLNFLLITLAITPLRRLTGQAWLVRFRRMFGLFAYFYLVLHFLSYAGIDQRFALGFILEDIADRPYITLGFTAFLMLSALALTSTRGMVRRLGPRWKKLHRLVYPAAILGVWHYYWLVKADLLEPLLYAAGLALLLGMRAWWRWRQRRAAASSSPA